MTHNSPLWGAFVKETETTETRLVEIELNHPLIMIRTRGDTCRQCVYRVTESQGRWSLTFLPWTAMFFLSCRIVSPADTCTVTVLIPSWENVYAILPSGVISGCWVRERGRRGTGDRDREGERERRREMDGSSHSGPTQERF